MKQCSKCKIEKSETEFHRHKDGIDGLNPSCKECVNTQHRAHYSTHLNQEKYRIKAYRETHLEDAKAYRNTHLEEIKAWKKAWYEAHPEQMKMRELRFYCSTFIKPLILKRDSYQCQLCNLKFNHGLEVHHINLVKTDPHLVLDPRNMITLCRKCHRTLAHPGGRLRQIDLTIQAKLSTIATAQEAVHPTEVPLLQKQVYRLSSDRVS